MATHVRCPGPSRYLLVCEPLDKVVNLIPGLRTGLSDFSVRAVREANRVVPSIAQLLNIVGGVVDIEVSADLLLLLHEAKIPVGNTVGIQPLHGLMDRHCVKVIVCSTAVHTAVGWLSIPIIGESCLGTQDIPSLVLV